MKGLLTWVLLLWCSGQVMAQTGGPVCAKFEQQARRYNEAVAGYQAGRVTYASLLKVSEKTRLTLKQCLLSAKDQLSDQEYYTKLYLNGLLLINAGKFSEAQTFFKQIAVTDLAQTRLLKLDGRALPEMARQQQVQCEKLKAGNEQAKFYYVTIWFDGKGSYIANALGERVYRSELKESLLAKPYFSFEKEKLREQVYPLKDSLEALRYFGAQFGKESQALEADREKTLMELRPVFARWDSLVRELRAYAAQHPGDPARYDNPAQTTDNEVWIFNNNFGYLTLPVEVRQQFQAPFLFIPGPGYFDVFNSDAKEFRRPPGILQHNSSVIRDSRGLSPELLSRAAGIIDQQDSLLTGLQQRPLFLYWYGLYQDSRKGTNTRQPDMVNHLPETMSSVTAFYDYMDHYLQVRNKPDQVVPVFLSGKNLNEKDYRRFSAFHKQVTLRSAAGKPGGYNKAAGNIVFWAASGRGTLNHELIHMILTYDFPEAPGWLNEGLASMFEETEFVYLPGGAAKLDTIRIKSNFRGYYIQAFYEKFRHHPAMEELLSAPYFDDEARQGVKDAYDRYFCYFLYDHGFLDRYYRGLRAEPGLAPAEEAQLLAKVSGVSLERLNKAWISWLNVQLGINDGRNTPLAASGNQTIIPEDESLPAGRPLAAAEISRRAQEHGRGRPGQGGTTAPPEVAARPVAATVPAVPVSLPPAGAVQQAPRRQPQDQQLQGQGRLDDWLDSIAGIFEKKKANPFDKELRKQMKALKADPFSVEQK